jgi:DNA-binding PadR family transcriptional regulator
MGMDRERRIDTHLPLRGVEFHILLSLAAGERHGYGILQDIEARGEASVPDVGTMYRALARMVESGLIEATARRPAPDGGDERRNYYRITSTGMRVARAEARRLESLMRAARLGGLLLKGVK